MRSTNPRVVIRQIREGDLEAMLTVLSRAFAREIEIRGFDLNRFQRYARLYRLSRFLTPIFDFLHKDYPIILVAAVANTVVGEVHLVPLGNKIWAIDSLAVDDAYSRQGIGRTLVKKSIDYALEKGAKRVLTTLRTDNNSAIRISCKLGHEIYEERVTLLCDLSKIASTKPNYGTICVRETRPNDGQQIIEIARTQDPIKTRMYEMKPETFKGSLTQKLINRLTGAHSKRLVAETNGRITGYAHVLLTSPQEAARIDALYIKDSASPKETTTALLDKIVDYLKTQKVTKLTANLSISNKELINTLIQLRFSTVAHFYGLICLDQ